MSNSIESMLRDALTNLAADATDQEAYLRSIGTWPSLDELALDLDGVAGASASVVPPEVGMAVRRLDEALAEMSGEGNASLWQPDALHGPEWASVRELARSALAVLM